MSKMKFELNYAGVGKLLKSQEMVSVLEGYANGIAARAGDGYSVYIGPNRANVSVETTTDEAYQDAMENNTLLKSLR